MRRWGVIAGLGALVALLLPLGASTSQADIGPNTTVAGEGVTIEAKFVSSVGWVKPGEGYPFQVIVTNTTADAVENIEVTITAPDGAVFLGANDPGATVSDAEITWAPDDLAAAPSPEEPTSAELVIDARSRSLGEDDEIVWKDLSASAELVYDTGPADLVSTTHGPKVIPTDPTYDTARYGDRPFPVVPVAYLDRPATAVAEDLARKINDPDTEGSTFNLYQELSYGQLFPQASIPSAGIATKDFTYDPGFEFTEIDPSSINTCTGGLTLGNTPDVIGTPVYENRIVDGWYQMPGNTAYYGADGFGSAVLGSLTGVGTLQAIDNGCGPTGKSVYDAANIADPEIDYDDFDTDKDGVVDFFMMVFTGLGGNGDSQLNGVPPYDNIWPHSSTLESDFIDPETGLGGYESDDQLHSLEGRAQCWIDSSYSDQDDCSADGGTGDDSLPVFVRVGPYNVNPESAIEHASVISHEYGHSLGLPDFYSTGSRTTYGDFNLMAEDKSQNMDVFSRQELGWVVPQPLHDGMHVDMPESDTDIHRIDWETPAGDPYTLEGPDVHNGPGWVAKLPARQIVDPALVASQASGSHVWWSQSGNDFGCAPDGGHNLDIYLPELAAVADGTDVTLDFKSYFNIEWDFDYGFVLVSTDGGDTFTSLESANGYTTPAILNPNQNGCQGTFGNGITGTGSSFDAGTATADRVLGSYGPPAFVDDAYDLSAFAGTQPIIRFSYATDPGLARPGWFIDDVRVTAGGTTVFASDFETTGGPDDPRIFNGGCKEGLGTRCTKGWQLVQASASSPADHAYYLEMRDRSGFDLDGKGENDRTPIAFEPGLLLVYTDESTGYGNIGVDGPPAQSPLDSKPEPGSETPDLGDATFTAADGDAAFQDTDWIDNYSDPKREAENGINPWKFDFGCLSFEVVEMSGNADGPATSPGDLTGDVDVDLGDGCVPFDYGRANDENRPPTAVAQAKSASALVGEDVSLDGSGSYDDRDVPDDLELAWDTDGDGEPDVEGASVRAAFDEVGDHIVTLLATDSGGLVGTDEVLVTVTDAPAPAPEPEPTPDPTPTPTPAPTELPATGGDAGVVGVVLLAAATGLALRRIART